MYREEPKIDQPQAVRVIRMVFGIGSPMNTVYWNINNTDHTDLSLLSFSVSMLPTCYQSWYWYLSRSEGSSEFPGLVKKVVVVVVVVQDKLTSHGFYNVFHQVF